MKVTQTTIDVIAIFVLVKGCERKEHHEFINRRAPEIAQYKLSAMSSTVTAEKMYHCSSPEFGIMFCPPEGERADIDLDELYDIATDAVEEAILELEGSEDES